MVTEQFDEFWEIRCPKCNKPIDIEILVNIFKKNVEDVQIATENKKS